MNIVIFSWRGPGHPNAGGAEIVTHEHAKAWVKAGHRVTLFTSLFSGGKSTETIDGVKIIRKGHDFIGVKVEALKWYLALKDKPDLVFDHFHGIPFFTPLYVKQKKVAFIHEVAKEVWWMNHLPFPSNLLYAATGYFSEPFIFRLFYRNVPFMTVSESTKKDLINWGIPPQKITIVHNGITRLKVEVKKEKRKTLVFLGALSKDKGIEDALRAFGLINQSKKKWQLWVVGSGGTKYLKHLKTLSSKLKINAVTKFWGYVDERKKFELFGRAHILINPSTREGWGLVNIEANSVGLPVVGYNVAGVKDSVRNRKTGLLSRRGDIRKLAANCLKLLDDPDAYRQFRKNAIRFSEEFSWEKSTQESLELIERLCKK